MLPTMLDRRELDDLGKLVLRVTIAGLMLFHGVHKLVNGIGGIESMVSSKGLPGFVAYGVYVGEVVAPIFILLGKFTRPAALVFAFNMVVATLLAHSGDIWKIGKHGNWGIEHQMLFCLPAIAIALIGPGRYSLSRGQGRWD